MDTEIRREVRWRGKGRVKLMWESLQKTKVEEGNEKMEQGSFMFYERKGRIRLIRTVRLREKLYTPDFVVMWR